MEAKKEENQSNSQVAESIIDNGEPPVTETPLTLFQ